MHNIKYIAFIYHGRLCSSIIVYDKYYIYTTLNHIIIRIVSKLNCSRPAGGRSSSFSVTSTNGLFRAVKYNGINLTNIYA